MENNNLDEKFKKRSKKKTNSKFDSNFKYKPKLKFNNKNYKNKYSPKTNYNSDFKIKYKEKIDNKFGRNSFDKLIEVRKELRNISYIRINNSKITNSQVLNFFRQNRVKFSETYLKNCFRIEKSFFNISSSIHTLCGNIYLQDLASQTQINMIDFSEFQKNCEIKVLDLCASPGSKLTQICDKLENLSFQYKVVGIEFEKKRVLRLINNIQKQGFSKVEIFNCNGIGFKYKERFDIVLLDAPCSGNLIGDKNWLSKRDFKGIFERAQIQKELLKTAVLNLKESGTLIYSTCSLEEEENEENVLWAEKNLKINSIESKFKFNFKTSPKEIFFEESLKKKYAKINSYRFQPYLSKTQGFFVTIFKHTKK